jgi:hypothetical protein
MRQYAKINMELVKMEKQDSLIRVGRPRLKVDFALVLHLRDEEYLGWTRGAAEYRKRTGQWISRDTFKRRYYEAKSTLKPALIKIDELKIKFTRERTAEEEWEQILRELWQGPLSPKNT